MKTRWLGRGLGALPCGLLCGAALLIGPKGAHGDEPSGPQASDQKTRQLWDDAFSQARPPGATRPARRPPHPAAPVAGPPAAGAAGAGDAFLGVTVWRLEPAGTADGSRAVAIRPRPGEAWLAHRVEMGAGFAQGQRVRLSFESSRSGFLYVIDRERYADGSFGEPYLIFPTLRLRQGANAVVPGRVVEIPDLGDRPPFFTIRRSRRDQVGEVLTVLLTPTTISDLPIGRDALRVPAERVRDWEARWGAPTKQLELPGGAGRPYTPEEREAGGNPARLLTQVDPLPQTLFRVASRPEAPVLVAVPLSMTRGD
jgi:hypothetical protein